MNLKKMMLFGAMLQATSPVHASDMLTNLTNAKTNLYNAQTLLSGLLNLPPADMQNNNLGQQQEIAAQITNNGDATVFLVMINQANHQINPTIIGLNPGDFSYIPTNATKVKIVDANKKQLVAPTVISSNSMYEVKNNQDSEWSIHSLRSRSYSYKNSTTIPVMLALTIDNKTTNIEKLLPGGEYLSEPMNTRTEAAVTVHANISPIFANYNPDMGYSITMDSNNLISLVPNQNSNKTIINNTSFPMMIYIQKDDSKDFDSGILSPKESYNQFQSLKNSMFTRNRALSNANQPESTMHIMVIPMIANYQSKVDTIKSCSIVNQQGSLNLQF